MSFHSSKNEFFSVRRPGITGVLLSLTISILVYFPLFEALFEIPLRQFPDRAIGITVLKGIDANARTLYYCLNLIFITLLFFILQYLFARLHTFFAVHMPERYLKSDLRIQQYLIIFELFLLLYGLFKDNGFYSRLVLSLLVLNGLLYFTAGLKVWIYTKHRAYFNYYQDHSHLVFSLLLSAGIFFAGWVVGFHSLVISTSNYLFFIIVSLLAYIFLPLLYSLAGLMIEKVRNASLMTAVVLAFIPVIIPLSNELHFSFIFLQGISPEAWARVLTAAIWVLAIASWFIFLFRNSRLKTTLVVHRIIFPVLLTGFFLSDAVRGQIIFPTFDLFHNGERMLITQQLFNFGKLPFADILPTHGVMDFFGQALYTFIHGYRGPEMFLWRWIPVLAGLLLWYFLLARLVAPFFAFLLILLTPESFLFHDYYRMILVVLFVLFWTYRRRSFTRYLVLWLSVVFLFFWRFDFGVIAALTTLATIPWLTYINPGNGYPGLFRLIKSLVPVFVAGITVFMVTAVLYSVLLWSQGLSPADFLSQWYYYFKIQAPTQTIPESYTVKNLLFFLEYIVTPFISVIILSVFLYQGLIQRRLIRKIQLLLVWLAVFSLIMTMRTIQRHALVEAFNPVLSMFLVAAFPFYFRWQNVWIPRYLFLISFLIYTMFLADIPRRGFVKSNPHSLTPRDTIFRFFSYPERGSRVVINDSSQFRNLNAFCNEHLRDDQTFFDFSNAPLLYVMTNREFPAHIIPNLYMAADPVQDYVIRLLERYRADGRLPVVVFSQGNNWDSVDRVPQPVRSYRISEFIYRHYQPFVLVDNYEIWMENRFRPTLNPMLTVPAPIVARDKIRVKDVNISEHSTDSLVVLAKQGMPAISGFLDLPEGFTIRKANTTALSFRFKGSGKGSCRFYFSTKVGMDYNKKPVSMELETNGRMVHQEIVFPGLMPGMKIKDIRMEMPPGGRIELFDFQWQEWKNIPLRKTRARRFNVGKLPYIWANYDQRSASDQTEILSVVLKTDQALDSGKVWTVPIDRQPDRGTGQYLHLTLTSPEGGDLSVSFGGENHSRIIFDLIASTKEQQYLVRISSSYAWTHEDISGIDLKSSANIVIHKILLRKGD